MPKKEPEKRDKLKDSMVEIDPPTKDKMLYMEKQRKRRLEDGLHDEFFNKELIDALTGRESSGEKLTYEQFMEKNKERFEELEELQNFIKAKEETMDVVFGIFHNSLKIEEELNKFILERYIKKGMSEEFLNNILLQEGFTASFKANILNQSKLLKKFGYERANNDLRRFLELRNSVAHGLRNYKTGSTHLKLKKSKEISLEDIRREFNILYLNLSFVFLRMSSFNVSGKLGLYHKDFSKDYATWLKYNMDSFEV